MLYNFQYYAMKEKKLFISIRYQGYFNKNKQNKCNAIFLSEKCSSTH